MSLRSPGRLITATPLTVTSSSTGKGMFTGDEVARYRQQGTWPGLPGAPTGLTTSVSNGKIIVSFTPPVDSGGSTITSYTVTSSPGNFTATGSSSPLTVTGLTNGTNYTFTVTATNGSGTGSPSAASSAASPSIFGGAYATLLSGFSGTKIYVNAATGSDTTNNGLSANTPFATITKAHTYRGTLAGGTTVMIIVYPGSYTLTSDYSSGSGSAPIYDGGYGTTYVCAPGAVTISFTVGADRDGGFFNLGSSSSVYGAILRRNNNGKTTAYSTSIINNTTLTFGANIYNCVFVETNANNAWSLDYDNGGAGSGSVNNCSFFVGATGLNDWTSSASLSFVNCAFNYSYGSSGTTKTNPLVLASHNMTDGSASPPYVSPGATNQGVYYGTYTWG